MTRRRATIALLMVAACALAIAVLTLNSRPVEPNAPACEFAPGTPGTTPLALTPDTADAAPGSAPFAAAAGTPAEVAAEAEELEFTAGCRVVFADSYPASTARLMDPGQFKVRVSSLFPGQEYASYEYLDVQPDWTCTDTMGAQDFVFDDKEFAADPIKLLRSGKWQVVAYFSPDDSTENFDNFDSVKPGEVLAGLITPRIQGREIDFGTITITPELGLAETEVLTGRIVHQSGTPLKFSGDHAISWEFEDDTWSRGVITGADGGFLCLASRGGLPADGGAAADLHWALSVCGDEYDDNEYDAESIGGRRPLPAPSVQDHVWDFGTITVGGGLLKVALDTGPLKTVVAGSGRPAINPNSGNWYGEREPLGEYVSFHLNSETTDCDLPLIPGPEAAAIWVPVGRHGYYARVHSNERMFQPVSGYVLIGPGEVQSLSLKFTARETIPVTVKAKDSGSVTAPQLYWSLQKDGEDIEDGNGVQNRDQWLVPVMPGCVTHVHFTASGYLPATADAAYGVKSIEIELEAEQRVEKPRSVLRITLPAAPAGVSGEVFTLVVSAGEISGDTDVGLKNDSQVAELALLPGVWSVVLAGGAYVGYPGGILCGPVEVTVTEGQTVEVDMPAIPPPPWDHAASCFLIQPTVGGKTVLLVAPFYDAVNEGHFMNESDVGWAVEFDAPPAFLDDGDRRIPLSIEPPQEADGDARIEIDLEARIEVRVYRNGRPLEDARAAVEKRDKLTGRRWECNAQLVDGVASLWAPPGPAEVRVIAGGKFVLRRQIEIVRGELTLIEEDSHLVQVEFRQAEADADKNVPEWELLVRNDAGEFVDAGTSPEGRRMLEPGFYRVVPEYGVSELQIDLDITDGHDREIELPPRPATETGECILKFDTALLGESYADLEFRCSMADVLPQRRTAPNYFQRAQYLSALVVPGGIRLTGVPMGQEIILTGRIASDHELGPWCLTPRRVKLEQSGTTLEATWVRGVRLHSDWRKLDIACVSLIAGYAIEFGASEIALAGRQEITVFKWGEIALRETVNPQSGAEYEIPPALRQKLVDLGLLK